MKNNDDQLSVQGDIFTLVDAEGYLVRENQITGLRQRYPLSGGGGGSEYYAGDGLSLADNTFSVNNTIARTTDIKTYSAGTGLSLNNTTFSVDTTTVALKSDIVAYSAGDGLSLSNGQFSVDNTIARASDIKTYSAGTGLSLNNTTFSVDTTTVALKSDIVTYSAGTGLSLNNTTFSIDTTTVALKTDIPTKLSDLTNDEGFITEELEPAFAAVSAVVTKKGNTFNTANNLVELNASAKVPSNLIADAVLTLEDGKALETSSFDANLNGAAVQKYNEGEAVSGTVSIGIVGTVAANTCATVELMIPINGNVTTITLPSYSTPIDIPTTIEFDDNYEYNYIVFVIRSFGSAEPVQINYSYKFGYIEVE